MGEAVRYDVPGRFALERVIANGRSCLQRCVDIAGLDERWLTLALEPVVLMFRPNASKTVGLQLHLDL